MIRAILLSGLLASVVACGDSRNECHASVSCAKLVTLTCGEHDACGATDDCAAAERLADDGDAAVCHTAWCNLGESYARCE